MKKEEEKKGISLVGFVVILIILVGIEGFYIVKLRNNSEPNTSNDYLCQTPVPTQTDSKVEENTTNQASIEQTKSSISSNEKIINALGYNANTMVDSIMTSLEQYAQNGLLIKNTIPVNEGENAEPVKITVEDINAIKEDYKTIIYNNIGNAEIIKSVKFESNKLVCDYNIQNLLELLNMTSLDYSALGANENKIKSFEF